MANNDLANYRAFIASKGAAACSIGFSMRSNWENLFPHQKATLRFACELKPEYANQAARFLQGAEQQSGSLLDLLK